MGVMKMITNYFSGHRQRVNQEQEVVRKAMEFQVIKGEVLRNQLTKEMRGLHSTEVRMYEAFAGLQADASRGKRGNPR